MWAAAKPVFCRQLPTGAADIPSRFIELMRRDKKGHGADKMGLGPGVFRAEILPALMAGGFSCTMLAESIAACRDATAALCHCNRGSWLERGADWDKRVREAMSKQRMDRAPVWLRPQGCAVLPEPLEPRRAARGAVAVRNGWPAPLRIPDDTRRVVVFSNVIKGVDLSGLKLGDGDVCIHCNHARHAAAAMAIPGTRHYCFVRHGKGREARGWHWYHEGGFDGFERVIFVDDASMLHPMQWYGEWKKVSGKSPTTGFIAANMVRELYPQVKLILAGFDPGVKHGTPMWGGHDWASEARWYGQRGFTLIRPEK